MPKPLLSLALLGLFSYTPDAMASEDMMQAYVNSSWMPCHADLLAGFWGVSMEDAKTTIGNKILYGNQQLLFEVMTEAERTTSKDCAGPTNPDTARKKYYDSTLNYNDAEMLAAFWGLPIDETKFRIGQQLMGGDEAGLKKTLEAAKKKAGASTAAAPDPRQAYYDSSYTYNDAEKLAALWGTDIDQAKATIGTKVSSGNNGYIDAALKKTAGENFPVLAYYAAKYEYCHAEQLASLWGSSVWDAKMTAGQKIVAGNKEILKSEIARAEREMPGHCSPQLGP